MAVIVHAQAGNTLEVMEEEECLALLKGMVLGRVAVSIGAIPGVFPVNYAMSDGDIFFLTAAGTKLSAALCGVVVAFEIDEVDCENRRGWSVLAVGEAHEVVDEAEALTARLALDPWAPGQRNHLVRIRPTFLSGRRIGLAGPA